MQCDAKMDCGRSAIDRLKPPGCVRQERVPLPNDPVYIEAVFVDLAIVAFGTKPAKAPARAA
jgi:hypothetical protein